jgi:hypothetical protein
MWARVSLQKDLFINPTNKTVSNPKWFISFASLDLNLVKGIRRKTNTHFGTVLMTMLAGAMRTFVLETGKSDEDHHLPDNIFVGHS